MSGLDIAFLTGRNALQVRQKQTNVAAGNVAGAANPAFRRQRVELVQETPVDDGTGQLGTGARVVTVVRAFDAALERNLQQALAQDGYHRALAGQLELAEGVLAPTTEAPLARALETFAYASQQVATAPENREYRQAFLAAGQVTAVEATRAAAQLHDLQRTIGSSGPDGILGSAVQEINGLTKELAQLNTQIAKAENRAFAPQPANDLRDRRDELVRELSRLADAEVIEEGNMLSVTVGGVSLVTAGTAVELTVDGTQQPPALVTAGGDVLHPQSGELAGILDAWQQVGTSAGRLGDLLRELATAVNDAHQAGFARDGQAGQEVFSISGNPPVLRFLLTETDAVAAAAAPGQLGDGTQARRIWELLADGSESLVPRVEREIDGLAVAVNRQQTLSESAADAVTLFHGAIQDACGVSVDEEMMAMLEIQRAYQATAKLITVVDDMLAAALAVVR